MRVYGHMVWAAVAATVAVGCNGGGDGLPREPVSGKVTLKGQPLDEGQITFAPTGGDGPPVGAKIENGAYALSRVDGPLSGPHRVTIHSYKPTGRKLRDDDNPSELYDEMAESIPDRYNAKSQLTVVVKPGGDNTFDFELTGRKVVTKVKR